MAKAKKCPTCGQVMGGSGDVESPAEDKMPGDAGEDAGEGEGGGVQIEIQGDPKAIRSIVKDLMDKATGGK